MDKRFFIGIVLTLGILIGVWQLYFPHIFERICWLPQDQYAKTIHVVSLGGRGDQINLIATTSRANIYYCARFGAIPQPSPVPAPPPPLPVNASQGTVFYDSIEVPVQKTVSGTSTTGNDW